MAECCFFKIHVRIKVVILQLTLAVFIKHLLWYCLMAAPSDICKVLCYVHVQTECWYVTSWDRGFWVMWPFWCFMWTCWESA